MSHKAEVHVVVTVDVDGIVRNDDAARSAAMQHWDNPDTIDIRGACVEWINRDEAIGDD